jgi:tetratricopeptide (TPR) repeat protein
LCCAGLFLGLLFVEAAMQAASRLLAWRQDFRRRPGSHGGPEAVRVLCLGESTTAPTWGPVDHSWPRQLAEILDAEEPGRFEVTNGAHGASNTDVLLKKAPDLLREHRPDVVIAMIGVNDSKWYARRAFPRLPSLPAPRTFLLARYLYHEVFRRRFADGGSPPSGPVKFPSEAAARAAKERDLRLARDRPDQFGPLLELGYIYRAEGDAASAEKYFRKALALRPAGSAFIELSQILLTQERYAELIDVGEWAIASGARAWRIYIALGTAYERTGRLAEAEEAFRQAARQNVFGEQRLLEFRVRHGAARDAVAGAPRTRENYRALRDLLKARGIGLICMQYPRRDVDDLRKIFPDDRDLAFVGNRENFEKALASARYEDLFVDRFGGDFGHCTRRGNRLIAESSAAAVRAWAAARKKSASF